MFKFFNRIEPASFFVCAAIVLSGVYYFLRPPMQSPDEFNHFLRAYQISEGQFLPVKKDQRLGGEVPVCFVQYMSLYTPSTVMLNYKITRQEINKGFDIEFSDTEKVFKDFPNTSNYSAVSYLPQSLVLLVLRQFNFSVGFMYNAGRLFAFFVWLLAMFYVIKTLPSYKWLFAMVLLLPMNMYLATSFTADTVTNILSFLLIALVLKFSFQTHKLSTKDIILLFIVCILLPLSKTIYVSLLLLLLLIPGRVFTSKLHKYSVLAAIVFISCFLAVFWSNQLSDYFIAYDDYNREFRIHTTIHEGSDYHKQKAYILAHGTHFFTVLYNTTFKTAQFYLLSYIGHFGTFMDTPVPFWFFVSSYLVILTVAVTEKNTNQLSLKKGLLIFYTALCVFSLIVLSQHLIWNNVGRDIADSIQGRYLIPVLPLIFILFNVPRLKTKLNVNAVVILFVFVANLYVFDLLYKRFYKESYKSKTEFFCNAEELGANTILKTSDPAIFLEGRNYLSTNYYRNGKHALFLPPNTSLSAVYEFKGIRYGDIVEMSAWQKKGKGQLILKIEGKKCEPFSFVHGHAQLKEKSGWENMRMIFTMPLACDSSKSVFYLNNPTNDTVYFDDLKYSIKNF